MAHLSSEQIQTLGGFYFVAPADEPGNRHAAGIDGNQFSDPSEAREAIDALRQTPGFEGEWVVRFCDHVG